MNIDSVDLSALISTRICHDLISPIGAINNGLELLDAVGATKGPELSLVNDSASAASAKLNVFRLAFGDANGTSEIKSDRLSKMISEMYGESRIIVDWRPTEASFRRDEVKLALLILFCIESSLPLGGTCTISTSSGIWTFKATSSKLNINNDLWNLVTRETDVEEVSPSFVHFLLARLTADQSSRAVKLHVSENELIAMVTDNR